jgi:hypothetical protein
MFSNITDQFRMLFTINRNIVVRPPVESHYHKTGAGYHSYEESGRNGNPGPHYCRSSISFHTKLSEKTMLVRTNYWLLPPIMNDQSSRSINGNSLT